MPSLAVRNLDEFIIKSERRGAHHHCSTGAEHWIFLAEVFLKPQRKSVAEALLSIPDVGTNTNFQRVNDETEVENGV
jgi:plasmid stability protein